MSCRTEAKTSKSLTKEENRLRATWIFGSLFILFFIGVFIFAPPTLPEFKQRILAVFSALLCGLFAFFIVGDIVMRGKSINTDFGTIGIKAGGGIAVFLLVLWWWFSPLAPVISENVNAIYRVRVTVLNLRQNPVEDARVWSSIGGEPKKVAGGWQFDIPAASKPTEGNITFYASKQTAFLAGKQDLRLAEDFNPAITIQLEKEKSVTVGGVVVDKSGRALSGVRVTVVGHEDTGVITSGSGNFVLTAYAADGQQVLLHAEKEGYRARNQWHPAGDEPATIILLRN